VFEPADRHKQLIVVNMDRRVLMRRDRKSEYLGGVRFRVAAGKPANLPLDGYETGRVRDRRVGSGPLLGDRYNLNYYVAADACDTADRSSARRRQQWR